VSHSRKSMFAKPMIIPAGRPSRRTSDFGSA
jgi:hypothetical protein